jgi:hypothetical protein
VLRLETIRRQASPSWVKAAVLLILIAAVAAMVGRRTPDSLHGTDFPDFYCAARMLLDGHGHQLYDADLQRRYQARYAGGVGTLYIHPPFEAVLYLVVAWLPLLNAYWLWSLLNLLFLAVGARRMAKGALVPWDWRLLIAASLTFVPLLLCLLQGQDSLLFLLLVILAFSALRTGHSFAAGCWLGLGLFKFQIVLPLILVLVLTSRGKARSEFVTGFSLFALTLSGISAAISGRSALLYPRFLLHLLTQPATGIAPQAMANFRGLAYLLFHRAQSSWASGLMLILSAGGLIKTLMVWRHAQFAPPANTPASPRYEYEYDFAFANTVLFSLLVSYYLNPHDLTLLLLPLSVMPHGVFVRETRAKSAADWIILSLIGLLLLPPMHLWALKAGIYALAAVPIVLLLLTGAALTKPTTSPRKATTAQD